MAQLDTLSTASAVMDTGMLTKAVIFIYGDDKFLKPKDSIKVQFNPQTYTISRGMKHARRKAIPLEDDGVAAESVTPTDAQLSVSLIFDTYTEYGLGQSLLPQAANAVGNMIGNNVSNLIHGRNNLPTADQEDTEAMDASVLDACNRFIRLVKFDHTLHTSPPIAFVWGTLKFQGKVSYSQVTYDMFARNGTPVRATLNLVISGEEAKFVSKNPTAKTESPDRTKRRSLEYGEQLWMLADQEYGSPGQWKTIARANGILNPRRLSGAMSLKVPSTR